MEIFKNFNAPGARSFLLKSSRAYPRHRGISLLGVFHFFVEWKERERDRRERGSPFKSTFQFPWENLSRFSFATFHLDGPLNYEYLFNLVLTATQIRRCLCLLGTSTSAPPLCFLLKRFTAVCNMQLGPFMNEITTAYPGEINVDGKLVHIKSSFLISISTCCYHKYPYFVISKQAVLCSSRLSILQFQFLITVMIIAVCL